MRTTTPLRQQKRHRLGHIVSCTAHFMLVLLLVLLSAFFLLSSPVQAQPTILPSLLPDGQVGSPYNATLVAVPLVCPCTWTITSGSLPPGLSLNPTSGTISGTPTTAGGPYSFFVQVQDSTAPPPSPQQGFSITITSPPLNILTTTLKIATESVPYAEALTVTGGTSPYTWSIVSGSLPTGLELHPTTGFISGTPIHGTAGSHSFTVSVIDSSPSPLSGQQSLSLLIEAGAFEPTVTIGSGLKAGQTNVFVEGTSVTMLRGGESISLSFDLGTSHNLGVDATVDHPTETGVRFKAEVDRITVSDLSPNASFAYYTEYFIELETAPPDIGQITGTGWYKEDYALRASAPSEIEVEDEPGTQYRFSHWELPTGETDSAERLNLPVSAPGNCTAHYDTYHLLTLTSPHGGTEKSAWYKAGSQAKWDFPTDEVRMSGILGVFGGKMKAINSSGTEVMDGPKEVDIEWESNYTMPLILIPLALLLLVFGSYGLYLLWRGLQPKPVPVAPPPQPVPPPQTTVVMLGEKSKQVPQTTREQLMERFGQLLEKYEEEITASTGTTRAEKPSRIETVREDKRLAAPEEADEDAAEAEIIPEGEDELCGFAGKKLIRTVVTSWTKIETKTADLAPGDEEMAESGTGLALVWERAIYQEWKIITCSLPPGHKGAHKGTTETVYSLLNTVTEEKVYEPGQKGGPPEPHYTDGMMQLDIDTVNIIPPDQLPPETVS